MSHVNLKPEHLCDTAPCQGAVELLLRPREKDLGGFSVRRCLPSAQRKMIGPWVFFDHMGPAAFAAGTGINVRPHPHIGIATVTYLFEGEILHRDSLGSLQAIRPGDINLMIAGKGIPNASVPKFSPRPTGSMACNSGWRCRKRMKKPNRPSSIMRMPTSRRCISTVCRYAS